MAMFWGNVINLLLLWISFSIHFLDYCHSPASIATHMLSPQEIQIQKYSACLLVKGRLSCSSCSYLPWLCRYVQATDDIYCLTRRKFVSASSTINWFTGHCICFLLTQFWPLDSTWKLVTVSVFHDMVAYSTWVYEKIQASST